MQLKYERGKKFICYTIITAFTAFIGFFLPVFSFADVGKYNYGDNTSETLTKKAWGAFGDKDYDAVIAYAKKCISLYGGRAKAQQNLLKDYPTGDDAFKQWALNDVGTCYFLMGEAYFAQKKYQLAKRAYNKVIKSLSCAQFYDPDGKYHVKIITPCQRKMGAIKSILGMQEQAGSEVKMEKLDVRRQLEEFDKKKYSK